MLTKKNTILLAVILVSILSLFYMFSGNDPTGQTGFNAIKTGIVNSLSKQRAISQQVGELGAEIDGSIETVGNIRQSNNAARDAIESIERENASIRDIIEDNRRRIAECQQIIDGMEKRAGQGDGQNKTGS